MTTFLVFVGIIALFILAKFIFDTYLTDRTKEDWNQYQKTNPEDAARILRNKGLDFNVNSSSIRNKREETKVDSFSKHTEQQVLYKFMAENSELAEIVKSGDVSQIRTFLSKNPDLTEAIYMESEFTDNPAEKYCIKAEKLFDNKDYLKAIPLINKGLTYDDPKTESSLYYLRADCNKQLMKYNDSLNDMDAAINALLKYSPEDFYLIGLFLEKRSEIKNELGDESGARQDYKKAEEYYAKYEAADMEYDEDEKDDDELY